VRCWRHPAAGGSHSVAAGRRQAGRDFSANSPPIGSKVNTGNPVSGRQNNQGFEGLAMSPDRHALNDQQFLVMARDTNLGFSDDDPTSVYRSVDLMDISQATNFANTKYDAPENPIAPKGVLDPSIKPVAYQPFLNMDDNVQLGRLGLHNGAPNDRNNLYEKWESLAVEPVGDPKAPQDYFLFIGSDNDFVTTKGMMTGSSYKDKADVDTLVLVYRVTLPTYSRRKRVRNWPRGLIKPTPIEDR